MSFVRHFLPLCVAALLLWLLTGKVSAQAVDVTVSIDRTRLLAGETTSLRVYGRIKPALQASSDRIFSWYVDMTNPGPASIRIDWNTMVMQTSDNMPGLFGSGANEGANNRRGIYNTFMNHAGAGKSSPVELFNVRVTALQDGSAALTVSAGTGVSNLSHDFIVAPSGGGDPYTGGDYGAAAFTGQVIPEFVTPTRLVELAGGSRRLDFPTVPGFNHRVEHSSDLNIWTNAPGFYFGSFTDAAAAGLKRRFYRVRLMR